MTTSLPTVPSRKRNRAQMELDDPQIDLDDGDEDNSDEVPDAPPVANDANLVLPSVPTRFRRTGNPNTPPVFYLSQAAISDACKETQQDIEDKCNQPDSAAKSKAGADAANVDPKGRLGDLAPNVREKAMALDAEARDKYKYKSKPDNKWVGDHCHGLWFKPSNLGSPTNLSRFVGGLNAMAGELGTAAQAAAGTAAEAAAKDKAARAAQLAGSDRMEDTWAQAMQGLADANPCIKARKCQLMPFSETDGGPKQARSGKGCCPGQTGHHLMPDTMFRSGPAPAPPPDPTPAPSSDGSTPPKKKRRKAKRDDKPKIGCWDNYSEGGAPVICLEGTSNNKENGSHGLMHEKTEQALEQFANMAEMDYHIARDMLAELVNNQFGCAKDCIAAQLDAYYSKAYSCDDPPFQQSKVKPDAGTGGKKPTATTPPNSGGSDNTNMS
ncbi:HNH/endonuclease VII fold toxin-2 domain-containing protein [Chitinimonas lacunae]|uniref:HNH/endonuclease VII fold toxin-2 domain-containing protein n=1 Tax=Chitinimonas lacunae TaxID=1963018 RepID=A0ABV8MTS5_9NEIS